MSEQPHNEAQNESHDHIQEESSLEHDVMESTELLHVDRYEGAWMRFAVVVTVIFLLAIIVSAFAIGIQLPGQYARITPEELADPNNPFNEAGLRELAPGKYEAYITAQMWSFTPAEIRIPVGSEITFYITARDVQHGFKLADTNVNVMALPGQISVLSAKFDEPGTFNFICHEYCGYIEGSPIGHQTMYGQLIVENPTEVATSE